eukprot:7090218-Ditylum_brightwellii.AAC.1
MTALVEILNEFIVTQDTRQLSNHEDRFNIDLSTTALFNGITSIDLPSNKNYEEAYCNDKE